MTSQQDYIRKSGELFVNTYARFPAVMVEGRGSRLRDATGREYLDFLSGIAVCSLGHAHSGVTQAIAAQAARLVHVSNLFHTIPQIEVAELLVTHSFADKVFFSNSGAEANEAAIKLARRYGNRNGRHEILSFSGSFHGRTLATVAATGQEKFHKGFEPLPAGFTIVPFGDLAAVERAVTPATCAILCEPIQGESGVRPFGADFLQDLRRLCDRHGLLLLFDEVQVGMGRTGSLFAYEQLGGVTPDIMTLANHQHGGGCLRAGEPCLDLWWEPGCLRCGQGGPERPAGRWFPAGSPREGGISRRATGQGERDIPHPGQRDARGRAPAGPCADRQGDSPWRRPREGRL